MKAKNRHRFSSSRSSFWKISTWKLSWIFWTTWVLGPLKVPFLLKIGSPAFWSPFWIFRVPLLNWSQCYMILSQNKFFGGYAPLSLHGLRSLHFSFMLEGSPADNCCQINFKHHQKGEIYTPAWKILMDPGRTRWTLSWTNRRSSSMAEDLTGFERRLKTLWRSWSVMQWRK